tara:strand:- start:938 stop:1378 length:441 start_codon:yes stop_codon:yes gene_type:complete
MGASQLGLDARFVTAEARVDNAKALLELVEAWMQTFESDAALLAHLEKERIPAAPVLSPEEAMVHPHFTERGMVRRVEDPNFGEITVTGLPAKFSSVPIPDTEPLAPLLGQHNQQVLSEVLGMSDKAIADFEDANILFSESAASSE